MLPVGPVVIELGWRVWYFLCIGLVDPGLRLPAKAPSFKSRILPGRLRGAHSHPLIPGAGRVAIPALLLLYNVCGVNGVVVGKTLDTRCRELAVIFFTGVATPEIISCTGSC